ncbi:MAG: hypothetical protein JXI43_06325 [Tissierellales bacterium]|nr:hypothetical protein [Tissierellales bacterium]
MHKNDDKYNSDSDPDLEELRKAWEALQVSQKSKKHINQPEIDELNMRLEALHQDQKNNTPKVDAPKVNRPKVLNAVHKSNTIKTEDVGGYKISMKKRGFFGRLFRKMYKNYMYGCSKSVNPMGYDYQSMLNNGDLEFEDMLDVKLYQQMINSPQFQAQDLADRIASNQEALERRKISQAMTWLVPRFESKLDEISQKIKKDW